MTSVHYNNQVRDSYLNIPAAEVQGYYEALRHFDDLLYSKENLVEIKLLTGS